MFAACLSTSCFIDKYAFVTSYSRKAEVTLPLLRSIDISVAQESILLFFVPPDIRRPKVPRKPLLRSGLVLCFSLSSCPTSRGTTTFPKDTTMMQRPAVAPWGMKAPCALWHDIGAFSAACTTAKSERKRCLIGRRHVRTSFAFGVVSNPVLVPPFGKKQDLPKFCRCAPGNTRSPEPELPHRNLQTSPVPVSLQHRALIHDNGVRSFFHAFDLIAASDSQSIAPTFVNGISLLQVIRSPLHPPLSMGC